MPNPRLRLRLKILAALFALLCGVLALAIGFPQQILTVESGPARGECLIVLGGGSVERPDRAAELFIAGEAPLIICSGAGDELANQSRLIEDGVPAPAILLESKSKSTQENAEFSVQLLRERNIKSAIIVTSWFHSRRALHCFEHYAPEIKFYSRPTYFAYKRTDWAKAGTASFLQWEYVKLLAYWVLYGICPV